MYLVDVPNILLQTDWDIRAYGYDANYTKHDVRYNVVSRTRPENYVYTDEEQKLWEQLEVRIDEIEENGVSEEQIGAAVEKYLDENNIEVDVDLTDYYTKTETDAAITDAIGKIDIPEVDLTGYATEKYVDEAIANIDINVEPGEVVIPDEVYVGTTQPTDNNIKIWVNPEEQIEYALKSDIPDTTGFTTMAAVEEKGYQTQEQVTTLINNALGVIENGTY